MILSESDKASPPVLIVNYDNLLRWYCAFISAGWSGKGRRHPAIMQLSWDWSTLKNWLLSEDFIPALIVGNASTARSGQIKLPLKPVLKALERKAKHSSSIFPCCQLGRAFDRTMADQKWQPTIWRRLAEEALLQAPHWNQEWMATLTLSFYRRLRTYRKSGLMINYQGKRAQFIKVKAMTGSL